MLVARLPSPLRTVDQLIVSILTALKATYEKQNALTGKGNTALTNAVLVMIVLYNTPFNIR